MALILSLTCQNSKPVSFIITNVKLIDGSGSPAQPGSVRIEEGKIADMGDLQAKEGERIVDGQGQTLVPGFIDTHSHHDQSRSSFNQAVAGIFLKRDVPELLSQGITSIIIGQDGGSHLPLSEFWEKLDSTPVAVNIGSYVGHNSLRKEVMGNDYKRPASAVEIMQMKQLLESELQSGAIGLATGLEYDPGIYSEPEEVLSLAAILSKYQRRYISHMRSEDRQLEAAIDELLNIGRQHKIPVQISHFKLARVSLWQKADRILAKLDSARAEGIEVTADIYPYEYWQSTLAVLFPERDFDDIEAARYALTELTTPEGVIISGFGPDETYIGKTLEEIAILRKQAPEVVCLDLIKEAEKAGVPCFVMAKSMHNDDIASIINWEHSNICSDGMLDDLHPRGAGSFPRIIRKYVREEKQLSLEKAIQKMSSAAALHLGIRDRGTIQKGYRADLVLMDPEKVRDLASFETPGALATGVLKVWVNGALVWDGEATRNFPGQKILAPD